MRYAIAISASLAALVHAAPQAIKVTEDGPVFPIDLKAEASSVLKTMASQSPAPTATATDVTVTAKPLTVVKSTKTSINVKTTLKKKTSKKVVKHTTKKQLKKAAKKVHKRQASASSSAKPSATTTTTTAATSTSAKAAVTTSAATTTFAPTSASSATTDIGSACAVQPTLQPYYPAAKDDASFLIDSKINADSNSTSISSAPSGYKWLFRNMMRTPQADAYMGSATLSSYNVTQCGAICDGAAGCKAFNIYYERNPSLNPADACPNPSPIANVVCTIWGAALDPVQLTNVGQWRSSFAVVIAGSNGYNKQ